MFLLLFGAVQVMAQERTVTGTVSDQDGASIPGVNIVVQGTSQGTVTDMDGNYSISVDDPNAVLVFSFIGLISQEVTVGTNTVINVTLENRFCSSGRSGDSRLWNHEEGKPDRCSI